MGINDNISLDRAVSLYNENVTNHLKEKRAVRLENKLAPKQIERLFPQDKVTLTSTNKDGAPQNTKTTTHYCLGPITKKKIIDTYA